MSQQNQLKAYRRQSPQQGYQQTPQAGSPTYTEAWALIEAARRLAEIIQNGDLAESETRKNLRAALRLNWRLWTIFQAELTVGESKVPDEIRENMLNLCKFVDEHTISTMSGPTPEKVVTLIDLNRNIASGLLTSLDEAARAATEAEAAIAEARKEGPQGELVNAITIDHEA